MCSDNIEDVKLFARKMTAYIKGLKIQDKPGVFTLVLQSQRKTGFLGFIVSLNSILQFYSQFVETDDLKHLRIYKFSQDHLELFFGSIRAHGGHNNNPTVRQFRSSYRKLVIKTNNIEEIDILHYSSADPVTVK